MDTTLQNGSVPSGGSNGGVINLTSDDVSNGSVTVSEEDDVTTESGEDLRCGYRSWRPDCLQTFNTSRFLLASVCWFTFVQGIVKRGLFVLEGLLQFRYQMEYSR